MNAAPKRRKNPVRPDREVVSDIAGHDDRESIGLHNTPMAQIAGVDHATSFSDASAPSPSGEQPWPIAVRVAFRFWFLYILIYTVPGPLQLIPGLEVLGMWIDSGWRIAVVWFADAVLRLAEPITIFPGGSGDTTFNYVQLVLQLLLALFGTIVWSFFGRRTSHPRLDDLLRTWVRWTLAAVMLGYGLAKVLNSQFPSPDAARLVTPYGDSSPMGILWTFMGASTPYTFFAGLAEVVGGVLLLWRRTTLLGACVVAGVMLNVVLLNFCYDVPVKLFSTHLLLAAVWLLARDRERIIGLLWTHRPVEPRPLHSPFPSRWMNIVRRTAKVLLLLWMAAAMPWGAWQAWTTWGNGRPKPAFAGVWEVREFSRDGDASTPRANDAGWWHRAVVQQWPGGEGMFLVDAVDRSWTRYRLAVDEAAKTFTLTEVPSNARRGAEPATTAPERTWTLTYSTPTPTILAVEGLLGDVRIAARLERRDESDFLLVSRGFRWINEFPYNR
jgi:hypothetical protein